MPTDDLMDWLGETASELTAEQLEQFRTESAAIELRYPHPDEQHLRDTAINTVLQYLLGDIVPAEIDRQLTDARLRQAEAFAAALQYAIVAHRVGRMSKTEAARRAGIDRMSLLKALQ